ncbi:MAG: NAD(P)-dependent oxidoreductase, partial [Chloroflexi bacterium]
MQVFIAGSTGVLGRRLIQKFTARGDKVVAMVRNEKGERIVSQLGAIARYADLFNVDS